MNELSLKKSELSGGKIKAIAFYLPQFHRIPENDKWWGEGFTEWTNTKKAKPLFEGHYQPRKPFNNNYYDLSDVKVMERQAELAKAYGLFGFCYYHYWFSDGKKLLEKPVEQMLRDEKVDIPFCLCWANENWTRNWDGGNRELLMRQDYGGKDFWDKHIQYLMEFFRDRRYITYEGKPVLLIYKPEPIVHFDSMIRSWHEKVKQEGFPGIVVVRQSPQFSIMSGWDSCMLDYTLKYEPGFSYWQECFQSMKRNNAKMNLKKILIKCGVYNSIKQFKSFITKEDHTKKLEVLDYEHTWQWIIEKNPYNEKYINGAFVDWDNTPRLTSGRVYDGATPAKFEKYMTELLHKPTAMNSIFINAWNEWAEGAYLEPDEKFGYGYLEALKKSIDSI